MAIGSHHSAREKSTTYLTPPEIVQALGEFDLDPCCPSGMPWKTADRMISLPTDGLTAEWKPGYRVWLNPPYGREADAWLARLSEHDFGTALVFARTETKAWQTHVWPKASAILFLSGRLHFHNRHGERYAANSGAPSALIAYGTIDAAFLKSSGIPGAYVDNVSTFKKD